MTDSLMTKGCPRRVGQGKRGCNDASNPWAAATLSISGFLRLRGGFKPPKAGFARWDFIRRGLSLQTESQRRDPGNRQSACQRTRAS
eukprot:CAMPEP_0183318122 /NCGR_PEP_ID=MMETSP0160_2-20130417/59798_1 /TAXON_ID=2839 ORGANISM="Odontella Sinensis, Strain Grunow 1884" /NCGR_SAMPLE_ID=MMETSP0160_2 /ASSEMBLY_ACC=CAM_ASM_000250 /LENGTH=86 /DNA_ID=CAMNT_0025484297 /DNA_START=68 /DNA_END=328 /DNA_ORIENTATION=-